MPKICRGDDNSLNPDQTSLESYGIHVLEIKLNLSHNGAVIQWIILCHKKLYEHKVLVETGHIMTMSVTTLYFLLAECSF